MPVSTINQGVNSPPVKFSYLYSVGKVDGLRSINIIMHADKSEYSIFILLDLTDAFDTIDNTVFIDGLLKCVGISGTASKLFH